MARVLTFFSRFEIIYNLEDLPPSISLAASSVVKLHPGFCQGFMFSQRSDSLAVLCEFSVVHLSMASILRIQCNQT